MIPAGPVLSFRNRRWIICIFAATGFIHRMSIIRASPIPGHRSVRAAVRLSETPGEIVARPPMLGEHTDLVLAELGYDTAAIMALRQSGII